MQFKTLYNATLEFEKSTKRSAASFRTRVLNKPMLTQWLDKGSPARSELPKKSRPKPRRQQLLQNRRLRPPAPEVELAAKAIEHLKPQNRWTRRPRWSAETPTSPGFGS